jgi:hypothetical protein
MFFFIMKKLIALCILLIGFESIAYDLGTFPAGIVYGPKAAFEICAPKGWVLDNSSGLSQGIHCVLYPKGETWGKSPVLMYAKIASPEYPKKDVFIEFAIEFFKKDDPKFTFCKVIDGNTKEGFEFTVYEYIRPRRSQYERVAYIQLPEAVAYIVFSAFEAEAFESGFEKLSEVINSIRYRPDCIGK